MSLKTQWILLSLILIALILYTLLIGFRLLIVYPMADYMSRSIEQQLHMIPWISSEKIPLPRQKKSPENEPNHLPFYRYLQKRLLELPSVRDVRIQSDKIWIMILDRNDWIGFDLPHLIKQKIYPALAWILLIALINIVIISAFTYSVHRQLNHISLKLPLLIEEKKIVPDLKRGTQELILLDQMIAQISAQQQQLKQDRELTLLAISHDLRAPLARITIAIDLAEMDPAIRQELEQDMHLIKRILNDFQAWVQNKKIRLKPVDPDRLIRQLCQIYQRAGQKIDYAPQSNDWVMADELILQRCLENLLQNAWQHGKPPVRIELKSIGKKVRFLIQDQGSGIRSDQIEQVKRPFVQLDPARNKGGSGLGLSLVQNYLRSMQSELKIESNQQGLLVWFDLNAGDKTPAA